MWSFLCLSDLSSLTTLLNFTKTARLFTLSLPPPPPNTHHHATVTSTHNSRLTLTLPPPPIPSPRRALTVADAPRPQAQLRSRAGTGEKWRRRRARHGGGGADGAVPESDLSPEEALEQERARLDMERSAIENDQSLIAEVRREGRGVSKGGGRGPECPKIEFWLGCQRGKLSTMKQEKRVGNCWLN